MTEIGMEKIQKYSSSLATRLYQGLQALGNPIKILTPEEEKSRNTMVSFIIEGYDFEDFGKQASKNKFRIRLVPESNLNAIRVSTHVYNNEDEVDSFLGLVSDIIKS